MRDWKETFGHFYTNSVDADLTKKIVICGNNTNERMTPEEMVIMAIKLSKQYNCIISSPVEFHPEMIGGHIAFEVECHSLTYRGFYDFGRTNHYCNTEVKEKDLVKYEARFGTRKCIDRAFRKKYWFSDSLNRRIREYRSLKAAIKAARQEYGTSISIHTNYPYGRPSEIVCFAEASGYVPP